MNTEDWERNPMPWLAGVPGGGGKNWTDTSAGCRGHSGVRQASSGGGVLVLYYLCALCEVRKPPWASISSSVNRPNNSAYWVGLRKRLGGWARGGPQARQGSPKGSPGWAWGFGERPACTSGPLGPLLKVRAGLFSPNRSVPGSKMRSPNLLCEQYAHFPQSNLNASY